MKPPALGRARTINLAIAAALVVTLVLAYLALRPSSGVASSGPQRTATATVADVTATVSATGASEPTTTAEVSFAASGTIGTIRVRVGSTVTKGQVLATLETSGLQSALEVAQAKYDAARDSYAAAVEGYDAAVAAESATTAASAPNQGQSQQSTQSVASASAQLASAKAGRLQAENDLSAARAALGAATLRSPLAGTVLSVNGMVGGSAAGSSGSGASGGSGGTSSTGGSSGSGGSSALFTVADLTHMQVSASFAEADAMQLKVGQGATTVFNAASGTPVQGKITSVAPTPTTSNGVVSYAVKVSLPTLPPGLRSGQTATVTVTTGSRSSVLAVPNGAISGNGSNRTVTVVANGKQTVTAVQTGLEGDQWTEVTSGLTQGQQVVLPTASSGSTSRFPGGGQFPGGGVGGGLGAGFGGGAEGGARP